MTMKIGQARHREAGDVYVAILLGTGANRNDGAVFDCDAEVPHPAIRQESMIEKQRAGQCGLAEKRAGATARARVNH
jgi:hypothetical protein